MTRQIRTSYIHTVLTFAAIVALLSWGVFAVLWTSPNDQGGTVNAVLNGENQIVGYLGLNGNGTTIKPGTEAQFIMVYRATIQANMGAGTYLPPNGQGLIFGPILWTTPSSTLSSFGVNYAVFTFEFSSQIGPGPQMWFSGPQGNLTASLVTTKYGGIVTRPFSDFQTSIFDVPSPGNYTLNYINTGSENSTGIVSMGTSSVVFTRPYLYAGVTTNVLAVALAVVTGFVLRRKRRQATTGPGVVTG